MSKDFQSQTSEQSQDREHAHTNTHIQLLKHSAATTYPTISLQGLHEVVIRLGVKVKPFFVHVLEVQVFVSRTSLVPLFPGRSSLVGGSLQVVLVMHFDRARQHVVHHHQSNVNPSGLDAVQAVELGQQGAWILVQVL